MVRSLLLEVRRGLLIFSIILPLIPATGFSQLGRIVEFLGTVNSDWSNALNWNFEPPPGPGDIAVINNKTVNLDQDATVAQLQISGTATSISGNFSITVTDTMIWNGGTFSGSGHIIIGSGAVLISDPFADANLHLDGWTLVNGGSVVLSLHLYTHNSAVIENNGTFETGSRSIFLADASAPSFTNAGTLIKSGIAFAEIDIAFVSTGAVQVTGGTLQLFGGGSSSNGIDISEDAALDLLSNAFTLNAGGDVSGAGILKLSGPTLTLASSVSVDKMQIDSGMVAGTGALTVNDTLWWFGGTIGGEGYVTIPLNAVLLAQGSIRSSSRTLDSRTIDIAGTMRVYADITVVNGGMINNAGTFELQGNHSILAGSGSELSMFHNASAGVLEKTVGPLLPEISIAGSIRIGFENAGTVHIGQLSILELTGPFANFASNTLTGGVYTLFGTFKFKNADIRTNEATISLNGTTSGIQDSLGNDALANMTFNGPNGGFNLVNRNISFSDSLRNEGAFAVEQGCSVTVAGNYIQADGNTWLKSGTGGGLTPNRGLVDVTGGTFNGNGSVYGSLTNNSILRVGDGIGTLNITNVFTQTSTGSLFIDIGGTAPGEDMDLLSTSVADLGGVVYASLSGGFTPTPGSNVFPFLNHPEVRFGTFSAVTDLDPNDGVRIIDQYGSFVTNLIANFAPFFTAAPNDTTISENQTLELGFFGEDPEQSPVYFSLLSGPAGAAIDSATGALNWTPTYDQAGIHMIRIGLSDTLEIAIDTVVVTVTNVNRSPLFTQYLPDTTIAENQALSFSILGVDPDLDLLTFEKLNGPGTISPSGVFSWTPSFADSGYHVIGISLTDGLLTVTDSAFIYVSNVNRFPSFTRAFPDTSFQENSTLGFSLLAVDADLDPITFAKVQGPGGLSVSSSGQVSWMTSYADSGTYQVVVSLSDGLATVFDTAQVYVSNVNRLPQFVASLPDTTISENQPLSFNLQGSDGDLDPLTFAKVSGPSGASVTSDGAFSWLPGYFDSGVDTLVVSLSDGLGSIVDTALITVLNVNRLPVLTRVLPDTSIAETDSLGFELLGSDPDLDVLTFTKTSGPAGSSLTAGGAFSWKTGYSDSGNHQIVVELSDGIAAVRDTTIVTVTNVNRLPAFTKPLPDTTVAENDSLGFMIAASDPDLDILTFTKISGPSGSAVSPSGIFFWETSYSDSGVHQLVVGLSDGITTVTDTALITVANVNRAPLFGFTLPDTTIGEDWALIVSYTATDPDGSLPAFGLVSGPPGSSISVTGAFSWTPSFLQAGVHTVVVSATDGLATVNDTARVTVFNVNRLPAVFALLEPANLDTVKLSVPTVPVQFLWRKAVDPDGDDTLRYIVHIEGPGLDTSITVETDTSVLIDLMNRVQPSSEYQWNVRVADRTDTVNASAGFSFRTHALVTGIADGMDAIPKQFILAQNYPNPFNPSTVIRYGLPVRSRVRLEVYDILGKRIATVVEGEQEARYYEVRWEAKVATGIYLYRLEVEGLDDPTQKFVQVKKMLLLR